MDNQKKLNNEVDMLRGNVNRMCVTDDEEELVNMQQWAKKRIDEIYILNRQRLKEKPSLIEAAQGLAKAAGIDFNSLSCYILVIIGWELGKLIF